MQIDTSGLKRANKRLAYTWSSVAEGPDFAKATAPLPFLVADGRAPGETIISLNTTVFEFNPWEMGSYDPTLYGFAPLRYIGSNFAQGALPDSEACVRGFDNAGYVMGTSSTLFNQFLLQIGGTSVPSFVKSALTAILNKVGQDQEDIADWSPNPFFGWNTQKNANANTKTLTLVDGGEDLQNLPLQPLIQPVRHVDVIFAVDSSADTSAPGANWPNATALVATYERSLEKDMANGTSFPAIPDQNTFVNLGLNAHPTFFGCNSSNTSSPAPLVVYLPNSPYTFFSNMSTFTLSYNDTERDAMVRNGYLSATMGNGTVDPQWPTCVGCAILSRSLERTKTKIPAVCTACFNTYCWNGTVNSTTPPPYAPNLGMLNFKVNTTSASTTGGKKNVAGTLLPSCLGLLLSLGITSLVAL
jgi:lysophospholipase